MWSLTIFAVFLAALTHTKAEDEENFALVRELNKLQTFFLQICFPSKILYKQETEKTRRKSSKVNDDVLESQLS